MYYNIFCGNSISALGLGAMRFPAENGKVNIKKSEAIIEKAIEYGINYFDTAYKYLDGMSEIILGNALKKYPRESWYLATKMPGHMMWKKNGKMSFRGYMSDEDFKSVDQIFEEQLRKCQVDYFDYYLLHNVNDISYALYTDDELNIIDYLCKQKKLGFIKHLGFSTHGSTETIKKFIEEYNCFEFVQIQLNYYDWFQGSAKEQYELLNKMKLPVVVMEPCRGGRLVNLNKEQSEILEKYDSKSSNANWAFKFLQNLDSVSVVLSGMSTLEQLEENVKTFSKRHTLNNVHYEVMKNVAETLKGLVLCTGCGYCYDSCPSGIKITNIIEYYNKTLGHKGILHVKEQESIWGELQKCKKCSLCERACPQKIRIQEIFNLLGNMV